MPHKDRHLRHLRGLCRNCKNYIKPPFKRCEKCLEVDRVRARVRMVELKKKRKLEGLCVHCGYKLNKIADKGRVSCINCRES